MKKKDVKARFAGSVRLILIAVALMFSAGLGCFLQGCGRGFCSISVLLHPLFPAAALLFCIRAGLTVQATASPTRVKHLLLIYAAGVFIPVVIYGVSWALGFLSLSWDMPAVKEILREYLARKGVKEIHLLLAVFLGGFFVGPAVLFLFSWPSEWFWRQWLMNDTPSFAGLLFSATAWALYHVPLAWSGVLYPGHPVVGSIEVFFNRFSLGLIMGAVYARTRSAVCSAVFWGVYMSAGSTLAVFASEYNMLVAGPEGLTGSILLLIVGLMLVYFTGSWRRLE